MYHLVRIGKPTPKVIKVLLQISTSIAFYGRNYEPRLMIIYPTNRRWARHNGPVIMMSLSMNNVKLDQFLHYYCYC